MVCGETLDGYTCTREGDHVGQHYDEVNEIQWKGDTITWLATLCPSKPRTTMLTETPPH